MLYKRYLQASICGLFIIGSVFIAKEEGWSFMTVFGLIMGVVGVPILLFQEQWTSFVEKIQSWRGKSAWQFNWKWFTESRFARFFGKTRYIEDRDSFELKGYWIHWTLPAIPFCWLLIIVALPFYKYLPFIGWFTLLCIILIPLQMMLFRYSIRVDRYRTKFQIRMGFIPIKTINSKTCDLVVDHIDAKHLNIVINTSKFNYRDHFNNLRFSFLTPWDGDYDEFYVDYLNEEVEFGTYDLEDLWKNLLKGLKRLQSRTAHQKINTETITVKNRRQIQFPLSESLCFELLLPFGCFFFLSIYDLLFDDNFKMVTNLWILAITFIPILIFLWAFIDPWVKFKYIDKVPSAKRWFKLPIPERSMTFINVVGCLILALGLSYLNDGRYKDGALLVAGVLLVLAFLSFASQHPKIWFSDDFSPSEPDTSGIPLEEKPFFMEGNFKYHDNGFTVDLEDESITAKWMEIEHIYAYKVDNYAYDTIMIQVDLSETVFRMSEEFEGYWMFVEKASENLEGFMEDWFFRVATPAFRTNLTEVYNKASVAA